MRTPPRSWLIRLLVSAAVLAVLFAFVPVRELWKAMRQVSPIVWLAAVLLFLAGHGASAFKWRLLMGPRDDVPASLWLRAHFAGLVANLCLPGVAGGDVVRAAWVMRGSGSREAVALASLADRAIDSMALVGLAIIGVSWSGQLGGPGGRVLTIATAVLVAAGIAVMAGYAVAARRARAGVLGRSIDAMRLLLSRPGVLFAALALSIAVQTSFVATNAWLGREVGVEVGLAAWLVGWPLAKLTALMSISLAGIGVREAALVVFMKPFGADAASVVAAGLLWEAVLATGGVVGWMLTHVQDCRSWRRACGSCGGVPARHARIRRHGHRT
ncbi:MAG: flippase-like domain-containing protein [Acidobacteria bacterium]|nr:flippase-like domain-containing protein [Acidobacteriota bacterium]